MEEVLPLGDPVNTQYNDDHPILSLDGKTMLFCRSGHPQNFGPDDADDIWISYRLPGGAWSRAINIGPPVNDRFLNHPVALCASGTRLYLTTTDPEQADPRATGLFVSSQQGRSWLTPVPVDIPNYYNSSPDRYFFVSSDERFLLFSADSKTDSTQLDLYISCRQDDGSWGIPQTLGPTINTGADERAVVLGVDERTLYFSSNGRSRHGDTDIFFSRRLDDSWTNWSAPVNLGAPVNTPADDDDFSLSAAGNVVILIRLRDEQQFDICQVSIPPALRPLPVVMIQGRLAPVSKGTTLHYFPLNPADDQPALSVAYPVVVGKDGAFRFVVPAATIAVSIFARNSQDFIPSQCLTLAGPDPVVPDADASPVIALLQNDAAYQQREKEIQLLLRQLRENIPLLDQLQAQLSAGQRITPQYLTRIDSTWRDLPDVLSIEQRYASFFLPSESLSEDSLPSAQTPADFSRQIWNRVLTECLPAVRREVEMNLIREELTTIAGGERSDASRQVFLEQRLALLEANPASEPSDTLQAGAAGTWQQQMATDLRTALLEPARKMLSTALRNPLKEGLDVRFRYNRRNLHQRNLQDELAGKLRLQMEAERRAGAGPLMTEPATVVPTIPPAVNFRELTLTLNGRPLQPGEPALLASVFFQPNSAALLPVSGIELDRLAETMRHYPNLGLEIVAHTHGQMSHLSAQSLTSERANTIASALADRGIAASRLITRGAGKLETIADSTTEAGRRQNQRIEIRWITL